MMLPDINFKNKNNHQRFFLIIFLSLIFLLSASSASAASCKKNDEPFFYSLAKPLISFAERTIKSFGYNVALATAPDPDFCGSDSVVCSGAIPTATISWNAAPSTLSVGCVDDGWGLVCPAFCYYVLTIDSNSYTVPVGATCDSKSVGNPATDNTKTISSGLANNTTYNWSVEAYYLSSGGGLGGASSASFGVTDQPSGSFTTDCSPPPPPPPPPPAGLSSTCSADGTQVTLTWNPVAGATGYQLRVDNTTNNNPGCVDGWFCADPPDKIVNDYTSTSYTATVVPNQLYGWWVHSSNAGGNSSAASASFTCIVPPPPPPPPTTPTNFKALPGADCHQLILSWTDVSNETRYEIDQSNDNGATWISLSSNWPADSTSYTVSGLSGNTNYDFQIRACNLAGCSGNATASGTTSACPTGVVNIEIKGPTGVFTPGPITINRNEGIEIRWNGTNVYACQASAVPANAQWTEAKLDSGGPDSINNILNTTTFSLVCLDDATNLPVGDSAVVNISFKPWWKEIIPW